MGVSHWGLDMISGRRTVDCEEIATSRDCLDKVPVVTEHLPQKDHLKPQVALGYEGGWPDKVDDCLLGNNLPPISDQDYKQVEGPAADIKRAPVLMQQPRFWDDDKIPKAQDAWRRYRFGSGLPKL